MRRRTLRLGTKALLLGFIILHPLSTAIAQLPSASDEVSLTAWSSGLAETGGQVTYTITLSNSRLEELLDVAVTDRLPEGFTYISG